MNNQSYDKVKITKATKQDGILTKIIRQQDNQTVKDSSQCFLSHGTGEVIHCEFKELPTIIAGTNEKQCLIHGVPKNQQTSFEILSEKEFKNNPQPNAITRTKKDIGYPTDSNIVLLNDVDDYPKDNLDFNVIDEITKIFPSFEQAEKIITDSTSSNIYKIGNDKPIFDPKGKHIYFHVKHDAEIERFKKIYEVRAWTNNHGFIKISRAGTLLERNFLFDVVAFGSPSRLDFVAGAKCDDGLEQKRKAPQYIDGTAFDIDSIPDLTPEEKQRYHLKVEQAKSLKKDEALEIRKAWIKTTAQKHYKKLKELNPNDNITIEQIESNLSAYSLDSLRFDLSAEFILQLDDDSFVSVGEIFSNLDKYDGVTLYDPFEPEEGRCKAQLFSNVGKGNRKPVIHSFVHGEIVYFLHKTKSEWLSKEEYAKKKQQELQELKDNFDSKNLPFCFWYETDKEKLMIDKLKLKKFLESEGYCIGIYNNQKYYMRIVNKQVKVIDDKDILSTVRNWITNDVIKQLPEVIGKHSVKYDLEHKLTDNIDYYIKLPLLQTLETKKIIKHTDTKDKTYFYFKNGFIEVTKDSIQLLDYNNLDGYIFTEHLLNKDDADIKSTLKYDIKLLSSSDIKESDFFKFMQNICTDKNKNQLKQDRFKALATNLGYMLNRYNQADYTKAVIMLDDNLDNEAQGGTGKSLCLESIGKMRNQTVIDGQAIKLNSDFMFSKVNEFTENIMIDDIKQNFDFNILFSHITHAVSYRSLYQNINSFNSSNNPKFCIPSNWQLKGNSQSHSRRKSEMEILPYYSETFSPNKDFGKFFYSEWNKKDWNSFYNVMIYCCQFYHKSNNKILKYESNTLELKRLQYEIGINALNFFDDFFSDDNAKNQYHKYQDLLEQYKNTLSDKQKVDVNNTMFTNLFKKYCEFHNMKYGYNKNKKEFIITDN